jgi:hypothetical protein
MKKTIVIFGFAAASAIALTQGHAQSGTFSTPAYNGTGARGANPAAASRQTRTNFNTSLGQNFSTPSGTSLGTNSGTSLGQPTTVLGQPTTAIGQQGVGTAITPSTPALTPSGTNSALTPRGTSIGIGQQNTTAIGQQGSGTAIGQQGTTAIGQQGVGTAIIPHTNGFIVNADGSVTGLPAQGGTSGTDLGGTNTGVGSAKATSLFLRRTNTFNRSP